MTAQPRKTAQTTARRSQETGPRNRAEPRTPKGEGCGLRGPAPQVADESKPTAQKTSSRENAASKARRYLVEGRVVIEIAGRAGVVALVRGDGTHHRVSYDRGGWYCTCPARGRCAHLLAVGLIVSRPGPQ